MNRGRNNTRGGGAMRQKVWKNQRIPPLMPNLSKPTANEVPAATNNGNYHRRIPWRRNPAASRPSRTQPYQIPGKSTQLNEQCFDLGTKNDYKYPSDHADTNNTNRNAQNQPEQCYDIDTKDRIPTEYSKTNGTGENAQNSRELSYDIDNKDRIPTEYAQMNGAYENNHNSRDDAKNRISTEYAQTNRTYQNYQNPRPQRVNFDARNRFRTKYNEVNGTYGNTRNSREQYSDFVAKSHHSAKYAQRNETLKRLQRWGGRQQARDNVKSAPYHVPAPIQNRAQERGYYTAEPPSERTQQNRAEERGYYTTEPPPERTQQNRAEERGYYTTEPPPERTQHNRAEERGYYTTEPPPERTQQPRMQEYPKAPLRKIWTTKIQPKNTSKVAPAQSADTEPKSVSNFIQPSPWFSAAEKVKSSYQNKQPEIRPLLGLAYEDIFETPNNKPDTSRNAVRRGWNASDYANKTLDDDIVPLDDPYAENTVRREWNMPAYAKEDLRDEAVHLDDSYSKTAAGHRWNASDYAPKDLPDDIVHLDNSYSKNSVDSTSKWVVPPELNMSIQSGVFFAKVCEAVLEKVLQQLCPNSRKATQKPGAESLNARLYSNRGGVMKRSMVTNGSSLLRNKVPQRRPAYAQSNIKNRFNEGYKKYAPKPSFRKPQLPPGVSSGRVEKRKKILTRNGKSLIYV